jgi:hypothetical protein
MTLTLAAAADGRPVSLAEFRGEKLIVGPWRVREAAHQNPLNPQPSVPSGH